MKRMLLIGLCCLTALTFGVIGSCSSGENEGTDAGNDAGEEDGGNQDPKVEDFIPAAADMAGWVEDEVDEHDNPAGIKGCYDQECAEYYINGDLDPYHEQATWVSLAFEVYVNEADDTLKVWLMVHEMATTQDAVDIFAYLETHPEGTPWVDLAMGDDGRKADQGPYWLAHVIKDQYMIVVKAWPGDENGEQPTADFIQAVLDELP